MRAHLFVLILSLSLPVLSSRCHYSCSTCTGAYYTQCLSCSNPSLKVTPTANCSNNGDQNILNQMGGICINQNTSNVNPFGITFLIFSIAAVIFLRSHNIFFFISSFQVLGLVALVQSAYPSGLQYILDSFQYFMVFSIMSRQSKQPNCKLALRSMYRMSNYFGTTNFKENSLPILPVCIIVASILALLSYLIKDRKDSLKFLNENAWNRILQGLRSFLFMTIQQSMLVIYVGIRFSSFDGGLILCMVIYCIGLIYLIVDCNVLSSSRPLFISTKFMNLNLVKRLVLPVLVSVPHNYTFYLLIFLIGFNLVQILLLFNSKKTKLKHVIYRLVQLLCILIVGAFLIADLGSNHQGQSYALGIMAIIFFTCYCLAFSIEILLAIIRLLKSTKIFNSGLQSAQKSRLTEKHSASRQNDTVSDLNSNQNERQTKVTPIQFSGARKGSDELKVTKQRLTEVRVEQIN